MKNLGLKGYLIWLLVVAGVLSVIGYNLIQRAKRTERLIEKEGKFSLGEVNIDTEKEKIWFKGKVFKDKGWVQHLVYLEGYKWLKEESAIISEAKLSDLQKAIGLLDWKLWDELWYGKRSKIKNQRSKMIVSVKWDGVEMLAQELVMAEDKLEIGDFIFLGSPHFDHLALEAPAGVDCDCRLCPIFPLEEKALRELFIRRSGQSGYELNSERMPAQRTEVTVVIKRAKVKD